MFESIRPTLIASLIVSFTSLSWPVLASPTALPQYDPAEYLPTDSRIWPSVEQAILLADLSKVQPASAVNQGDRRTKQQWTVVDYETDLFSGNALTVYPETGAPVVSLPLNVTGWHAVYIGVGSASDGIGATANAVRVKLSGDDAFKRMSNHQRVEPALNNRRESIQEVFLAIAQLDGQSVEFAQVPFVRSTVMYVKLVPLSEDEALAWKTRNDDPVIKPVIATFDGHSWIWPYQPRTAAHLKETFEGFQGTDVSKWWFQVLGADLVMYPSEVGTVPGWDTKDFPRWEYREFVEALKALFVDGINPLQVAREAAREQGVEFHVFVRPSAWKGALSLEEVFDSRFYEAHPEWRCVDRDGTPTYYMSYAVPEVREHILNVLRETLELDPDGVGYLFHRGLPMILWEDAFADRFIERYDVDPRQIDEDDPRIHEMRAVIMTQFMKETRAMLDEVQEQMGRGEPFAISLATFSTEADNHRYGIDLENWIQAGLVDEVAIGWFAHHTSFSEGRVAPDMPYYRRITEGTDVGVYPFVIAWNPGTPERLSETVATYYDEGATGIAIWDPQVEQGWRGGHERNVFEVMSLLGREDHVRRWAEDSVPKPLVIPLTRFGDNHYSRWFPNTGF